MMINYVHLMSFHRIAHELLYHVYSPIYYRRILPKLQLSRIQQMLIVLLRLRLHRQEISLY